MKIGIMGGTFDPIHIGHLILATRAMEQKKLDEVWFIPTGVSYLKSNKKVSDAADRYEMVKLAIGNTPGLKVSDIEINRAGNTYTYETLEQLKQEYADDEFYFIFGADCLFTIENWKYPERIFAAANIITAVRNDVPLEEIKSKISFLEEMYGAKIDLLKFDNLEISSSDIRSRIREGMSIKYIVPDSVIDYINDKKLYIDKCSE